MKYVIFVIADQTICYLTPRHEMTTAHKDAMLFDTREVAEAFAVQHPGYRRAGTQPPKLGDDVHIEEVLDVREFQAREDTW